MSAVPRVMFAIRLVCLVIFVFVSAAFAETLTVTSLNDVGVGSGNSGDLRYCMNRSVALAGADTIVFAVSGTIALTSSLPTITGDALRIDAGRRTIIVDGQDIPGLSPFRAEKGAIMRLVGFTVMRGHSANNFGGCVDARFGATLELDRMTIENCTTESEGGGGVFSLGSTVVVNDSRILNNKMIASGASGAGISANGGGSLLVRGSLIDGNRLAKSNDRGGTGIEIFNVPDARIENSTISNNINGAFGAGIQSSLSRLRISNSTIYGNRGLNAGGVASMGGFPGMDVTTTIRNSTITNNSADSNGGGIVINGSNARLTIANSIVAGNSASIGADIFNSVVLDFAGKNIATTGVVNMGTVIGAENLIVTDPQLLPFGNYGGAIPVRPIAQTSPARNFGVLSEALDTQSLPLLTDGRGSGFARVIDGLVDVGAFESAMPQKAYDLSGKVIFGERIGRGTIVVRAVGVQNGTVRWGVANPIGTYRFLHLPASREYRIEVVAKGSSFAARNVSVISDVVNFDLVSLP